MPERSAPSLHHPHALCQDSLEFLPADSTLFVCGNYQLRDGARIGRTLLCSFDTPECSCRTHQVIESPAVLDLKWSYQLFGSRHLLAQATADGACRVYSMAAERSQVAAPLLELQSSSTPLERDTIALSLDWSNRRDSSAPRMAASFSDGTLRVFDCESAHESLPVLVRFFSLSFSIFLPLSSTFPTDAVCIPELLDGARNGGLDCGV